MWGWTNDFRFTRRCLRPLKILDLEGAGCRMKHEDSWRALCWPWLSILQKKKNSRFPSNEQFRPQSNIKPSSWLKHHCPQLSWVVTQISSLSIKNLPDISNFSPTTNPSWLFYLHSKQQSKAASEKPKKCWNLPVSNPRNNSKSIKHSFNDPRELARDVELRVQTPEIATINIQRGSFVIMENCVNKF